MLDYQTHQTNLLRQQIRGICPTIYEIAPTNLLIFREYFSQFLCVRMYHRRIMRQYCKNQSTKTMYIAFY
jgi:hypothetical protein